MLKVMESSGAINFVESAIEWPLMLRQTKISSAEVRKSSTTESDSEVLHVHKIELGDDKSLTSPRASDLELKIPIDGGNASPFDFGENVVAVHFESSYSKQGHEQNQSSDFEVEKSIGTDRNQRSMRLTGQQEIIKYRREESYSSFPNLLRESDDQRSVDLEYPDLCGLFFGKQRVSRR